MIAKPFSKASDEWLKANHNPKVTVKELTVAYNKVFGENRTADVMKSHIRLLGLKQERRRTTKEEDVWLAKNAPLLSVEKTAELFNKHFGSSKSAQVLKVRCNKYLKVHHANVRGEACKLPLNAETHYSSNYTYVKVSNKATGSNGFYKNWKPKQRIVWEEHYGALPKGQFIVFLDKNRRNCSITNLYAVTGQILRELGKKQWFSENPDVTLSAIKWCELYYSLKDKGGV